MNKQEKVRGERKEVLSNEEKRLIVLANQIPLSKIVKCPDKKGSIRCPFKERHINGDRNKSAYYYKDKNLIHCFTFHETWTPVSLIAEKGGCSKLVAAKFLLKKFGHPECSFYHKSKVDIKAVFASLRKSKWESLKSCFLGEQKYGGIVEFIDSMELESEESKITPEFIEEDCRKIRELIIEGGENG